MNRHILSFVVLVLIRSGLSKIAPDYIKPCPGLKPECLKASAQVALPQLAKGIPGLGIAVMDPLEQKKVDLELPGGLKVVFWNGTVDGLKNCVVDSLKYENNKAELKLHCALTVKGLYKASGRILLFTLNGDGEVDIQPSNTVLNCIFRFEDKVRNGVLYHDLKDYKVTHEYAGRVKFNITNLLKGSPTLSETILTFLNENWKTVADEFGKPIVDHIVKDVMVNIKKFFRGVPKQELFI